MKYRFCMAAFPCVALLLSAAAAWADVPSLANSTVPRGIQLVGHDAGTPDLQGIAVVIVRDASGVAVPGVTVYIDFELCMPPNQPSKDLWFQRDQFRQSVDGFPMYWTNWSGIVGPPPTRTPVAWATTDVLGRARFQILGSASAAPGNSPGITSPCARVTIEGLGSVLLHVSAYDLNGMTGVNPVDLSLFLPTLFGQYRSRADYNGSGTVTAADVSRWLTVFFGSGSLVSAPGPFD